MAPPRRVSDDALRDLQRQGHDQAEIARRTGISPQAVSRRLRKLETPAAARLPETVRRVDEDLWAIRPAVEDLYRELVRMRDAAVGNTERLGIIAETRRTIETALKCLEASFTAERQLAFEESVLSVLREIDPTLRQRVIERFREDRSVRAAFIPR